MLKEADIILWGSGHYAIGEWSWKDHEPWFGSGLYGCCNDTRFSALYQWTRPSGGHLSDPDSMQIRKANQISNIYKTLLKKKYSYIGKLGENRIH